MHLFPRVSLLSLLASWAMLLVAAPVIALDEIPGEADLPAPVKTMNLSEGDCVVFLGDSITHQCLYTQYVEDFFFTRFPNKRIQFHNAGVGGAKAWDALQRFEKDVAAYEPEYVTVLLGMNDGKYQPFNQEIFDTYEQDMRKVIEKIEAIGAVPILMTPTMFDARVARAADRGDEARWEYYNAVMAYYGTWLRRVSYRNGYGMVDMWSPLNNLTLEMRQTNPDFMMIPDGVHPAPGGQFVMAFAILEDMNLIEGPLWRIAINAKREELKQKSDGGKLSNLEQTESGIRFTWKADSLPFAVPKEARLGMKLTNAGRRASRETLRVSGLPAGKYQLLIDGKAVGTYSANRLANGIGLQRNEKTPQYQQALKVAMLNKKRNAGPVHAVRGQWSIFQAYARMKRRVAENPDDTEAKAALEKLEKKVAGMEERVDKFEAKSQAMVDRIYEINEPEAHEYELRRVKEQGQATQQQPKGTAVVSGRVTLRGEPLSGADVSLSGQNGQFEAMTDEEGKYSFSKKIPEGKYTVAITQSKVSDRYGDAEQTSLRIAVEEGENVFDFNLAN